MRCALLLINVLHLLGRFQLSRMRWPTPSKLRMYVISRRIDDDDGVSRTAYRQRHVFGPIDPNESPCHSQQTNTKPTERADDVGPLKPQDNRNQFQMD